MVGNEKVIESTLMRREIHEVKTVRINDLKKQDIFGILKEAYGRIIFVVDDSRILQGVVTEGEYIRNIHTKDVDNMINKNGLYCYDDKDVLEKACSKFALYEAVLAIPVVDRNKRILYVLGRNRSIDLFEIEMAQKYNKLFSRFIKIQKNIEHNLQKHFLSKGYCNIAIWGINHFSISIGEEIFEEKNLNLLGLFGEKIPLINFLNYNVGNRIFQGCGTLIDLSNQIDCILVVNLDRLESLAVKEKISNVPMLYIDAFLTEIEDHQEYLSLQNTKMILKKKGVDLLSVVLPNHLNSTHGNSEVVKRGVFLCKSDEKEFLDNISKRPPIMAKGNLRCHSDFTSRYINCFQGERFTVQQPDVFSNTIFIIGYCVADGMNSKDEDTVASRLQSMCNDNAIPYKIRAYGGGHDVNIEYYLNWLAYFNFRAGDVVVFIDSKSSVSDVMYDIDMTECFQKLYQRENFFIDQYPCHCNYKGYQLIAEEIFKKVKNRVLQETISIGQSTDVKIGGNKAFDYNKQLSIYVDELHKYRNMDGKQGAIVMNCNPFTLGHYYLIETALKEVDFLYIFIVEEDLSYFSFKDRIRLVRESVKHIDRICIIPSGKFIISNYTFSGYFTKDTPSSTAVDASLDVEIFGRDIAPVLNITTRFVGEEPFDKVTCYYNQKLKEILPMYGIEVKEIPRKKIGENFVSASIVRKYLQENRFEDIRCLVPDIVFQHLYKIYRLEK